MKLAQMERLAVALDPPHLTALGRAQRNFGWVRELDAILRRTWVGKLRTLEEAGELVMASYSDYAENKIQDHVWGKAAWTMPATVAVALCTVVPTDASTGATITEASYTGYTRVVVAAANVAAASGGSSSNSAQLTGGACTASSSTIIGYAVLDSSTIGAGNSLMWGTCASTVVSTTQTPPTIAVGALASSTD